MRVKIQPYNSTSISARRLAVACGVQRVLLGRRDNGLVYTRFIPRDCDLIINWGSGQQLFDDRWYFNTPDEVYVAGDKLKAFRAMARGGVRTVPFTDDREEALAWLDDGCTVVARKTLRGSRGRGIVIAEPGMELAEAPLYTKYIKKYDEYRVHVWAGEVLTIQQKRRRRGERETNSRVRSAAGGWVYCRQDVNCEPVVIEESIKAVKSLGLDFGAADVGFTRSTGRAHIYEVNTAPGIEGSTVECYRAAVRSLY